MTKTGVNIPDRAETWQECVHQSSNPWQTFGDHLIWLMIDIAASSFAVPHLNKRRTKSNVKTTPHQADDERSKKRADSERFAATIDSVRRFQASRAYLLKGVDWVLSRDEATAFRSYLSKDPLSLLVSCEPKNELGPDPTYKVSQGFLKKLIRQSRSPVAVKLHEDDLMRWLRVCDEFLDAIKEERSVYEVLDLLQRWLEEADNFAELAGIAREPERSRFRPLPDDHSVAVKEIGESFSQRHLSAPKIPNEMIWTAIEFIAESDENKTVSRAEFCKMLKDRGRTSTGPSPNNICRELFLRGYARIGNCQGSVDEDVRHKTSG